MTVTSRKKPFRRNEKSKIQTIAESGFIETQDGAALFYEIFGAPKEAKRPVLVFCDGVGCDGYIWKYLVPALANCRIIHWNYRGHGKSSVCRDYATLTILQMTRDLALVLDTLLEADEKAILIGHSMGVQVILEFQRRFARRVAGLVAVCGAAGHPLDTFMHTKILKHLFPLLLAFFRFSPALAGQIWKRTLTNPQFYYPAVIFQLTSTLCSKADLTPYFEHLGRIDSRVFMELAHDMGKHTSAGHLRKINVPTLVFAGNRDNFTPLSRSMELVDKIPGAEFCLVPGGTHTAPLEIPDLISLKIQEFLRDQNEGRES